MGFKGFGGRERHGDQLSKKDGVFLWVMRVLSMEGERLKVGFNSKIGRAHV